MSTVCQNLSTKVRLARKVRFDSVNEFDSETRWLAGDEPTRASTFTLRARVGIDPEVNSPPLFNMIAHISHKAEDPFVSFRFFRPAPVNGMKKFMSAVSLKDGFSRVRLGMTFLGPNGVEKFRKIFSSSMDICGLDCGCSKSSASANKLPCHTIVAFCPIDTLLDALCTQQFKSGEQLVHLFAVFNIELSGKDDPNYEDPSSTPPLAVAMKRMLDTSMLYDITLRVGEQEFYAHRSILACHSSVFCAMFQADMRERNESTVEMTDISPSTVAVLLKYLYYRDTAEVQEDLPMALNILEAAHKYDMRELQELCEDSLCKSPAEKFTMDLALDAYALGNKLDIPHLEQHAVQVFMTKSTEMLKSECLTKFCESSGDLASNLIYRLTTLGSLQG